MAEYIDRADAHKVIIDNSYIDDMLKDLYELPAADVAPVVHCRECVHLGFKDCYGICEGGPMCGIVRPWDYCSHGVRKEKLKDGDE